MKSRVAFLLLLLLVLAPACAHHMGGQTTKGALNAFAESVEAEPGQRPAEAIAGRAVNGALTELSQPAQQERLDAVMGGAADAFRSRIAEGLIADLGRAGDGPLADSMVATTERAAAGAARGVMTALLAGCDQKDPSCVDRRVSDLSMLAAVAFTDGVKRSLAVPALAIAFAAGAGMVLFLVGLWRLSRGAREPRDSRDDPRNRPERRRSFDTTNPSISTSS